MEEYLKFERHAKIQGWKRFIPVLASYKGIVLIKGDTHIWQVRNGWQVADKRQGYGGRNYFVNHRPVKTLVEAIDLNS